EAARHGDHGNGNQRVFRLGGDVLHEGTVDLQRVEGEAAQVAEAGVARAEIVHGQRDTERLQALQLMAGGLKVLHDYRFGELDFKLTGVDAGVGQRICDALAKI